jgi:hypothetical protein
MKLHKLIILTIVGLVHLHINAADYFKLDKSNGAASKIDINRVFTENRTFSPFSSHSSISGLSISGSIEKKSKDFLVRVILVDNDNREHLVLESYNMLNDDLNISIDDYCEETRLLNGINPKAIKVVTKNATLYFTDIKLTDKNNTNTNWARNFEEIKKEQVKAKIERINDYNFKHKKLWRAGITQLSLKRYEDRKRILGIRDDTHTGGIEYYYDGIFEIGEALPVNRNQNTTLYIDSFDWRNRHGKNWITPNKDQEDSGFCCAFTAVGATEAMTNLYYNQLINVDLSEQEAACCNGYNNPWTGMPLSAPLSYIRDYGVCDDVVYPFVNDSLESLNCRSSFICPNELIKIGGYVSVSRTENNMKNAIINHGPLASSIHCFWYNPDSTHYIISHAMLIVGYGQLHVGDTIYRYIEPNGLFNGAFTVKEEDPRIGCTYWIYKNSYGTTMDEAHQGYMHIIHYNYSNSVGSTYYCSPSITSMNYSNSDIVCEDADGDGYYFWGIGPKPSHCPSWAPDTPDGDDSNINYGTLDSYGHLNALPAGITIKTPVTYSSNSSTSYRLGIVNGGSLTITGTTTLTGNSKIRVCEGGALIVDGGILQNADITMVPGSQLIVRNNGIINMASGKTFEALKGVVVNIESGVIN